MAYYYQAKGSARRHFYSSEPLWTCPAQPGGKDHDQLAEELAALGFSKDMLRRAHLGSRGIVDGRCDRCGYPAEKLGYRAWTEEPSTEEYKKRIAERLGFEHPYRTVTSKLFATKREAIAWAREQAAVDETVMKEGR